MANYEKLKIAISDVIKKNGKQLITGEILQSVLLQMVNIIGENATFAGIADTQTTPGTPDQNVFYMAFAAGDYPNFGSAKLPIDSIAVFENSTGAWVSHVYTFAAGKVDKTDIADNLTTNNSEKVLSAKQGVAIKNLIDALQRLVDTNTQSIKNNSTIITDQGNTIQSQQQTITQHGRDISTQASQISAQGVRLSTNESAVSSIENELTQQGETISTQGRTIEEQGRAITSQSSEIQTLKTGKQDTLKSGENIKSINGKSVVGSGNVVINETINYLNWTTNAATTRKLVPEELRAKDVRIAYTNSNGVYIVEKYKVETIDDDNWTNNANWKGCRTPLTPLFENAGAKFNNETGYYEMNELIDLTENDCIKMYAYYKPNAIMTSYSGMWQNSSIRTNFPIPNPDHPYEWRFAYRECYNLEIAKPSGQSSLLVKTFNTALQNCNKLRKVLTIIRCFNNDTNINFNLPLLEYYKIKAIQANASLISPKINYESVRYWIDNAANTGAITITVHPTTYGYLTGTIQPTPEVGGTTEEWQQIVTDAQAKQISFVTE